MGELTINQLKALLEGNGLDLNMRNIEKIPVKALVSLKVYCCVFRTAGKKCVE